jgi:transposase
MSRRSGRTPEQREVFWTNIIQEARAYAAGVTAYCDDNNVSIHTYYSWFRRLRPKHPEWQDNLHAKTVGGKTNQEETQVTEPGELTHRRTFTADYKAEILKAAEEAPHGQVVALLRREGLHGSHLQKWKLARNTTGLEPQKRGPKANPLLAENKRLEKEAAKLRKQLERANAVIEFQKKIFGFQRNNNGQRKTDGRGA